MRRTRLGEVMVQAGIVPQGFLDVLRAEDDAMTGAQLIERSAADGFGSESSIAKKIASFMGLPYADLPKISVDPSVTRTLPRALAWRYEVVPLETIENGLVVATSDPTDLVTIDDLRTATGIARIAVAMASPTAISETLGRVYSVDTAAGEVLDGIGTGRTAEVVAEQSAEVDDAASLEEAAQQGPIVTLVNALLADALRGRATDIHIEPHHQDVCVRHRVDGQLREIVRLPKHLQPLIISRLKIISGMNITERRKPQDGRSRVLLDGKEVATRVSSLPSHLGEKIVVRLLQRGREVSDLGALGLESEQESILREHLEFPHGLIAFTGPTGAGKTSTMYASLAHVRTPTKNIVSLEDPIEYEIDGVTQVPIEEKGGVTFPTGLRSILRQDPDVIMVGEIRDLETAQMVARSAATGHLVLSSLHTNDAASAVGRLAGLGLEPYQIAGALSLVVAQRLVRTICGSCKGPAEVDQRVVTALGLTLSDLERLQPMAGNGCPACGDTGYRGRVGLFEILPITEEMSENMMLRPIRHGGVDGGVRSGTLRENGLKKVAAGLVTLEEVLATTYRQPKDVVRLDERPHSRAGSGPGSKNRVALVAEGG